MFWLIRSSVSIEILSSLDLNITSDIGRNIDLRQTSQLIREVDEDHPGDTRGKETGRKEGKRCNRRLVGVDATRRRQDHAVGRRLPDRGRSISSDPTLCLIDPCTIDDAKTVNTTAARLDVRLLSICGLV